MLLIYSPIQSYWQPQNGAGWAANGAAASSRDPADVAVLDWPSGTSTITLKTSFTAPVRLGGLGLLATTLPDTTTISVEGQTTAGGAYSVTLAPATPFADLPGGGRGAILDFGAAAPLVTGAQITLTSPGASGHYAIGSIITGPAVRPWIQTGWESGDTDPSVTRRMLGSGVHRVPRVGYRTLTVTPVYADHGGALEDGLTGINWQTLRRILRADPYVLAAPLTGSQADLDTIAVYGIVTRLPRVSSLPGPNYQPSQLAIEEVPGS